MKQIFENIFMNNKQLMTINLVPRAKVYGEKLVKKSNQEYREWDPSRSKLGAALANGLKNMPISKKSKILYLGASTGTTVSHVSDIIGQEGIIYAVEFAERVMRKLIDLSRKRKNIVPIIGDARKTDEYNWIEQVDVIFTDIADPQETEMTIRNASEFLKKDGIIMIAVKSQSIDVTKDSDLVYKQEQDKLIQAGYEILEVVNLEPYEKNHAMIVARK